MSELQPAPERPAAAKLILWLVLGLVIFNLVLFGKFILASSGAGAPGAGSATNAVR